MPDLSKIKLDGTTYNLKDTYARNELEKFIHVYGTYGEETGSIILSKEAYGENPYPYQYWYSKQPTLILLDIRNGDGDQEHMGLYLANMEYYILTLKQLDGNKIFKSEHIINKNLGWNNPTIVYDKGTYLKDFNGYVGTVSIDLQTNIASFSGITFSQIDNALSNNLPVIYKYYCGEGSQEYKIYYLAYSYYNDSLHYIFYNLDFDTIHQIDITYSNQLYNQSTDEFTGTLSSITIPQISDWARASTKPTYTAAEVGALPDTTIIPTKINDLTEYKNFGIGYIDCTNINRYIFISNVTFSSSDASDFSSYFLLMFIRKTENSGSVRIAGTGNFKFYDINSNALNGYTTQISSATIATLKYNTLYIARLNDGELDLYPLTTRSEVNSLITSAIGNINSFEVSVVASLPITNIDTHTIYFISNSSSGDNIYDEYMYINNNWEKIGSTAVDLSNYLQKTDISDWAKASTKPSYTAGEVGAATSDHTHTEIGITGRDNRGKVITTSSSVEIDAYMGQGGDSNITLNPGRIELLASAKTSTNNTTSIIFSTWPYSGSKIQHIKLSDGATTINGVVTPTTNDMAVNKKYVDDAISGISIPVTSVNGTTGAVIVDKIKLASMENNEEFYFVNTGAINTTSAQQLQVNPLLTFAKTKDYGRLTLGSTSTPGRIRLYSSINNASGFTDLISEVSSTNERIITFPDASGTVALTSNIPSVPSWALQSSKPTYTAAEVGALPLTSNGNITITNTGKSTSTIQFINDDDNPGLIKILAEEVRINGIPTPTSNNQAVNKKYVDDSIATITHPTNISAFNNDVGYLTSFTETDPTVPAWAKAATKPTYTASEVGAAASNHTHSRISSYAGSGDGYVEVSSNYAVIEASTNGGGTQNILKLTGTTTTIHKVVTPTADGDAANKKYVDDSIAAITHPTNVSTFTNDAGYLTLADLPIYDGTVV